MPKSGEHRVNTIDSFFKVRPSYQNIKEGESISFLEDGKLVKQEKRNGVVYEQTFVEQNLSKKQPGQATGDVTNLIVSGSSTSGADLTGITAGTGLTGGGASGNITLNVIGGTGITANANDIAIDSTVTTLTGSQTLTNKTLTSPVINTSVSGTAILDEDNMSSDSNSKLATQQSIKAYVDNELAGLVDSAPAALNTLNELAAAMGDDANFSTTVTNSIAAKLPLSGGQMTGNITFSGSQTVDGRDLSVDGSKLDGIEASADVTDATNVTAAGALMDSEVTDLDGIKSLTVPNSTTISTFGASLVDDANASTARGTLGLGTLATRSEIDDMDQIATGIKLTTGETFVDSDDNLMTAGAIDDRIDSKISSSTYSFSVTDGSTSQTIASGNTLTLTGGKGVDIAVSATDTATFTFDGAELDDFSSHMAGSDEFLVLDGSTSKRKAANEIKLTIFDDTGFSAGAVSAVANGADNRIATFSSSDALNGESNLTFDGTDLAIASTGKLYFGGGSHTYIHEQADDILEIVVGGEIQLKLTEAGNGVEIPVDSHPLKIGAGSDLQLNHNGADSFVENYTGNLNIINNTDDGDIILKSDDGSGGTTAYITLDGSATRVDVSQDLRIPVDNKQFKIGAGEDLLLYHDGNTHIQSNTAPLIINQVANSTMEFKTNNTSAMIINASQNVGIGTTSPSYKLDITHAGSGLRLNSSADQQLRFERTSANAFSIEHDTSRIYLYNRTTSTAAVAVDNAGNFGIGTVSPTAKLDVRGNVNFFSSDASDFVSFTQSDNGIIINSAGSTSNKMTLNTGGTTALTIDASQNIGIGITSPSSRLHISENGGSTDDAFQVSPDNGGNRTMTINGEKINVTTTNGSSAQELVLNDNGGAVSVGGDFEISATNKLYLDGGSNTYITESSADRVKIFVGGDEMLNLIESSTNVVRVEDETYLGVGSSTDLFMYHSSGNSFINNGTGNLTIRNQTDDGDLILQSDDGSGGLQSYITLDGSAETVEIGQKMQFPASHSADKIVMYSGGNEKIGTEANTLLFTGANHVFHDTSNNDMMKITASGVFVDDISGLSNGTNKLVLDDDTRSGLANGVSLTGVNTVYICCDETNNGTGEIQFLKGTDNDLDAGTAVQMARIDNNSIFYIDDIYSMSNNNNRLILDDDTNSSQANGVSLTGANHVYLCPDETNNNTGDVRIITGTNNDLDSGTATEIARIDNSGNAHFDADVVAFSSTVSDKRLKENITTIQGGLDKVLSLRGVEYDWTATSRKGEHDIGLIAQEVEKVIPEVVVEHDLCTGEFGLGKEKTFKTVDYEKIVGVLVEAIKELKQEIEELK